jgi:hypothetical protein
MAGLADGVVVGCPQACTMSARASGIRWEPGGASTAEDRPAARLLFSGTHFGYLLGHPPTGRRFSYSGATFLLTKDGLLVQAWVLGDVADLTRQLLDKRLEWDGESSPDGMGQTCASKG